MEQIDIFADMGESTANIASLKSRIEQLEHERGELQRDIEQLCMQQSGSGYVGVITRIQAQNFAICTNQNLRRITRQSNKLKFFQSQVAAAFSERDRAIMEVERAYQEEESMSDKLNEIQNRMEEITVLSLCELHSTTTDHGYISNYVNM